MTIQVNTVEIKKKQKKIDKRESNDFLSNFETIASRIHEPVNTVKDINLSNYKRIKSSCQKRAKT